MEKADYPYPKHVVPVPFNLASLLDNRQDIANQDSQAPRGSKTILSAPDPINTQNILDRSTNYWVDQFGLDIWKTILQCSCLKNILNFRLTSSDFKNLIDNLLSEKASVVFQLQTLNPLSDPTIQDKFSFAKTKNTEIRIVFTVQELNYFLGTLWINEKHRYGSLSKDNLKWDLLEWGYDSAELDRLYLFLLQIKPIPKNKFKLVVHIDAPFEIDQLYGLLIKKSDSFKSQFLKYSSDENIRHILRLKERKANILIDKIQGLHFKILDFDSAIGHRIDILIMQLADARALTHFSFRTISPPFDFKLPPSLNSLTYLSIDCIKSGTCDLSDSIENCKTLTIGSIEPGAILQLPEYLDNLTNLSIDCIKSGATCNLSDSMKNCETLTISAIESGAILKLPKHLDKLETLILGDIGKGDNFPYSQSVNIELPKPLHALKKCIIGNIFGRSTLDLPYSLNSLEIFEIGEIDWNATLIFSDVNIDFKLTGGGGADFSLPQTLLENLISLKIKCQRALTINGPCDKLEQLTIHNCYHITLPNKLESLKSLSLDELCENYDFLPKTLPNLTSLDIARSWVLDRLQFLDYLPNLKSLSINEMDYFHPDFFFRSLICFIGIKMAQKEPSLHFLNLFSALTSLSIGSISHDTICNLPSFLQNLKIITIKTIGKNVTIGAESPLYNLKMLSIGRIEKDVSLKLLMSLPALETLSIGDIDEDATLALRKSLQNLKTLSIQSIKKNATLKIPSLFPAKVNFTIKTIYESAYLDLSGALDDQIKIALRSIWENAEHIRLESKSNSESIDTR